MEWPRPPEVEKNDPQAGVKLALYQAQLDVLKADHLAELALMKAKADAEIALAKAEADAKIEDRKREAAADVEREKADWASDHTQTQAVNSAYLEVAKGAIERGAARATFVQGAATAISGAYLGVLGLSFAIAAGEPLPGRGILPGAFLGLAIALAAAYVAFVTKPQDVQMIPLSGTLPENQRQRRNSFIVWARAPVLGRRNLLQASVVSLGVGVGILPLPYLSISTTWSAIVAGLAALAVLSVLMARKDTTESVR